MSKTRLLAATFVRLGLPLVDVLVTGGAATVAAGAASGVVGRLVGETSKLGQEAGASIVCDWIGDRLQQRPADPLRNHDLVRVSGDAIAEIIARFRRGRAATVAAGSPQLAHLKQLADGAAAAWQRLPGDALAGPALSELLAGQARGFEHGGGLTEDAWQELVQQLIAAVLPGRHRITRATAAELATTLHRQFPSAVRELLKRDAAADGEAYAGLVLTMLGEILAAVQAHPEHDVSARIQTSIEALYGDVKADLERLGATLDANADARHVQALDRLGHLRRMLNHTAKRVDQTHQIVQRIEAQQAQWIHHQAAAPEEAAAETAGFTPLDTLIDTGAADPWGALLDRVNSEALQCYRAAAGTAPSTPDAPERLLSSAPWEPYLNDCARWVEVRDEVSGAPADAEVLNRLLESAAPPSQPLRLWIVAEPGTGKTTLLYRIFFRMLAWADAGDDRLPRPMLLQPHLLQPELIQRLNDASPDTLVEALTAIWLHRRRIRTSTDERAHLSSALRRQLEDGSVVLLVDSFDELNRMRVQRHLVQGLFSQTRRFICASRVEAFREVHGERRRDGYAEVRLAPRWSLPTIRQFLSQSVPGHLDEIEAVVAQIRDHERAEYLRNARYLALLVQFYRQGVRVQQSPAPEASSEFAHFMIAARCGEYALLTMLYEDAAERLLNTAALRGLDAGPALERQIRDAFAQIARDQLRDGACVMPAARLDTPEPGDEAWALVRECTDFLRPPARVNGAYELRLKNFTLIDFFLTPGITDALQSERGALDFGHLWSSDLLMFVSAALREQARASGRLSRTYERIWEQLDRVQMRPDTLPADAPCRPRRTDEAERFRAVNLVHLALRLRQDALDPGGQTAPERVRAQITFRHHSPDFSHLDLEGVDLNHVHFEECRFDGAVLAHAQLDGARFTDCSFRQVNLREARAAFATFTDCTFDFHTRATSDAPEADSPVAGLLIHHAEIKDFAMRRTTFQEHGARMFSSRYLGAFGRAFFKRQSQFLGTGLREAERAYLETIYDAVPAPPAPAYLIDLMAGGASERKMNRIASSPHLHVLAIDRDTHQLLALSEAMGPRYAIRQHEITGRAGLADALKSAFDVDRADLIIGKKALHELRRADQRALIRECAEVLAPGGHLIILADAPAALQPTAYERLQTYAEPLRTAQREGTADLPALEAFYCNELHFEAHDNDAAIYANLWVLMKDWANGNEHEVEHRYFSSAAEIRTWATAEADLIETRTHDPFHYTLAARRFNEAGVNWVGLYLDRTDGTIYPADRGSVRHHLIGGARHALFYRFADRHLWDAATNRPTPLGAMLGATQEAIRFRDIFPALGAIEMPPVYERATAFRFSVRLLHFRKPASGRAPSRPILD